MSVLYPRMIGTADTTDSKGFEVITASGTAHTKGSWTALLAATAFDIRWLEVTWLTTRVSATDTKQLLDIGYDPAGGTTYVVLVNNLMSGYIDVRGGAGCALPCFIPAGSTVAARIQADVTSDTAEVGVIAHGGIFGDNPDPTQGLIVSYGPVTADSGGVTLADAADDTKSAWVELTGATTHPHQGLTVGIQGSGITTMVTAHQLIDIGIGAAASEVVVIPNIPVRRRNDETVIYLTRTLCFPLSVPEGVRIAARSQGSTGAESDLDVAVYGWG